jgi:hypothetical protein
VPTELRLAGTPPAAKTLRAYALAAVATIAGGAADDDAPEAALLRTLAAGADWGDWKEGLRRDLADPADEDAALIRLARELELSPIEVLAVALAAAVEEDPRIGRGLAWLQAPVGGSRPTVGLLASCLGPLAPQGTHPIEALAHGVAVRCGLLAVAADGGPLPERPMRIPLPLASALRGSDGFYPGAEIGMNEAIPLPASILQEAERHAAALGSAPRRGLVLRTGSPAEGRAAAAAIASALGLRPVFLGTEETAGLGPWLRLRGLLPIFVCDPGPGERKVLPALPLYAGPVLALCGPDGSVELAGAPGPSWSLGVPPREEREDLWRSALGDDPLAGELARNHRHGAGRIALLGRLAAHRAALRGGERPERADVAAASWTGEGGGLESLAQPLPDAIPDEALVLTAALRRELDLLVLRCRARDRLVEGLGASATARYRPGVRALLVGPSGTGKTLAAGWIATRLALPLYRVDLASVTSKYIGETEKNLAQLLARAEQAEVVLLFDEADSMFGKRTDVRDSNDRFANAQTNYLLQRIESFDGIVLLTSNSRARFDSAFSRRLDAILDFPLPGPEERRALWQSHLGTAHRVAPRDLNQLAALAELGGGHIRNAVLTAAVLAQEAVRPLELQDVLQGLHTEYRKLGKPMPLELKAPA